MPAQTGSAAIAAAKADATTQPTTDGFLNAIQYYEYASGAVYTAITSPGYVTTIALLPKEKLITASAGDTVRWLVDSVQSGSGGMAQTLLIVKRSIVAINDDCHGHLRNIAQAFGPIGRLSSGT